VSWKLNECSLHSQTSIQIHDKHYKSHLKIQFDLDDLYTLFRSKSNQQLEIKGCLEEVSFKPQSFEKHCITIEIIQWTWPFLEFTQKPDRLQESGSTGSAHVRQELCWGLCYSLRRRWRNVRPEPSIRTNNKVNLVSLGLRVVRLRVFRWCDPPGLEKSMGSLPGVPWPRLPWKTTPAWLVLKMTPACEMAGLW
jgi:hypothetical protein